MRAVQVVKRTILISAALLAAVAIAKDSKLAVPEYVLQAHTVAVILDPGAGVSVDNPNANQTAQKDVETALLNWGRFTPVLGAQQADLVIVLRKGHSKLTQETVGDPRQNSRPGTITSADDGISVGAQHGSQPSLSGGQNPDGMQSGANRPHPQLEVGGSEDSFEVYEGKVGRPLDGSPGWRWVRRDGLHPHDVPAVAEFRKAIAEAEKQAAKQANKKP